MVNLAKKKRKLLTLNLEAIDSMSSGEYVSRWMEKSKFWFSRKVVTGDLDSYTKEKIVSNDVTSINYMHEDGVTGNVSAVKNGDGGNEGDGSLGKDEDGVVGEDVSVVNAGDGVVRGDVSMVKDGDGGDEGKVSLVNDGNSVVGEDVSVVNPGDGGVRGDVSMVKDGGGGDEGKGRLVNDGNNVVGEDVSVVNPGHGGVRGDVSMVKVGDGADEGKERLVNDGDSVVGEDVSVVNAGDGVVREDVSMVNAGDGIVRGDVRIVKDGDGGDEGKGRLVNDGDSIVGEDVSMGNAGDGVAGGDVSIVNTPDENLVPDAVDEWTIDSEDVDFFKNDDDKGKIASRYDAVPEDLNNKGNVANDVDLVQNVDAEENMPTEELKGINYLIGGILDGYPIQKEIIDKLHVADNVNNDVNNANNRKRKIQRLSSEERTKRDREAHKLIPASCKCETGCGNEINEEDREDINSRFWHLRYNDRKIFLCQAACKGHVKRRRTDTPRGKRRSGNYEYLFKIGEIDISVCQKFFL